MRKTYAFVSLLAIVTIALARPSFAEDRRTPASASAPKPPISASRTRTAKSSTSTIHLARSSFWNGPIPNAPSSSGTMPRKTMLTLNRPISGQRRRLARDQFQLFRHQRLRQTVGDRAEHFLSRSERSSGATGHAYHATNTPNMYIIGTDGTLLYQGGIDNDPARRHVQRQDQLCSPGTGRNPRRQKRLRSADQALRLQREVQGLGSRPV